MTTKIKVILLDYDGVLFDVLHAHRLVINEIWRQRVGDDKGCLDRLLKSYDIHAFSVEDLFFHLIPSYEQYSGRRIGLTVNEATLMWCELYSQANLRAGLLPGTVEALRRLWWTVGGPGIGHLAIVTNRAEPMDHVIVDHIGGYFSRIFKLPELKLPKKPAPDGLLYACDQLGVKPEEAIYVGDAPYDAQAAKAAGIRYCEVLTGWPGVPRDYPAERYEDLLSLAKVLWNTS
ncbi:MAG: HAD family hydrolase [bacterium]|nr:HAD family hydrolase [bacterium]